jgi:hypothetical protein
MTCAECRDAFSAYADDALGAEARAAVEHHLAGCSECRREWQRFTATVDLLHAVPSERAPAGFVDRVMAAARPLAWHRRLARAVLVPWTVKLPLEAAAVVMVAGLAVLIFQRSSEMQQFAREPQAQTAPALEETAKTQRKDATARVAEHEVMTSAPPAPSAPPRGYDLPPQGLTDSRAAVPEAKRDAARSEGEVSPEPLLARRQQIPESESFKALRPAAPSPAPAAKSAPVPPNVAATAAPPAETRAKREDTVAKEAERDADQVQRLVARVPAAVELRLTVTDRAATERDIASIVERLGGALVAGPASGTLEIMVPSTAFGALASDLARLGTLRIVRQPAELPDSVRINLRLTD